jgi:GntR family transcriptional repressor for pyruvate dehydrogenase complex
MTLSFQKMISKKSYQHVVEQIQDAILSGELNEGDRLPSELKLKEMFDTSRGTIREALRVLEQKGLVSIKTGVKGGATIRQAGTRPISDGIGLLIAQRQVPLSDLAQFRTMLEGFVAYQAARKATAGQKRALAAILSEIEALLETRPSSWQQFNRLDAKFHQALADIADNLLVKANLKTIHENIHNYFHQYLPFSARILNEDYKDLCGILEAVEKKDAPTARQLAEEHVRRFNTLMEEQTAKSRKSSH